MNYKITDNERTFNRLFQLIMYDRKYTKRGYRKYRILFFGFFFGAINTDNLFQIFFEDIIIDYEQIRSAHANTLNYLLKQKYLIKGKESYYFVAKPGVDALYNYLCSLHLIDKEFFYSLHRQVRLHSSHAANTGLTLLSLSKSDYTNFYISRALDTFGITSSLSSINSIFPDAIAIDESHNHILCIEADSSTEHRNSGLNTKLLNYVNYFSTYEHSNVSILFSIWNKNLDANHNIKLKLSLHLLFDMYKLLNSCSGIKITFIEFVDKFSLYSNDLQYICNLISIKRIYIPDVNYSIDYNKIIEYILFMNSFTKSYFSRKNYIKILSANSSIICSEFIKGLSLITTPISASHSILNFINYSAVFIDNFVLKYHIELIQFKRKFQSIFTSNSNDGSLVFRNTYTFISGTESYLLAFENVSEDLGGYVRCKNYLSRYSETSHKRFILVCIFNDLEVPDFMNDFLFHYPNSKSVHFISYSEMFNLTFSRDEN